MDQPPTEEELKANIGGVRPIKKRKMLNKCVYTGKAVNVFEYEKDVKTRC